MRKVKATIYFPVQSTATKDIVIEVPDGEDEVIYCKENEVAIIERELAFDDVITAVDLGYAGITDIEIIEEQTGRAIK